MKRVIFVDDEPNVLEGIKVSLHQMRDEWTMAFAHDAVRALAMMEEAEEPFDVIVSDMNMPGMGGKDLLHVVKETYPQTVRMVLSGQLDAENVVQAAVVAHQILRKPCEPALLRERLTRAFALNNYLKNCPMRDDLFAMCGIPSVPTVYWKLLNEINDEKPSIVKIGEIIETDPSMSAKIQESD